MYKLDSYGNEYYDGSDLQITRYTDGSNYADINALKTTYYATNKDSIVNRIIEKYDTILNGTTNNSIKRIYPTVTSDITKNDYAPLATTCDAYSEVGLSYPNESTAEIKNNYIKIKFTVNDDLEYTQADYNNYKINGAKTFFYDTDNENLIDTRYRWAVLNDYVSFDRKIHIPFVKKVDYDESLNIVEVMRYNLKFELKTSGITSDIYTNVVNKSYKGNGSDPVPTKSQGTSNYAIPSQLCYTKFVTIGPIGYDSAYSLHKETIASGTGNDIAQTIDGNHENRNRVVAHVIPPYKLYSIFFYHGELFIQEDYYTKSTILHDSVKNSEKCSITNIMKYYYPSITGDYSRCVKIASNLPENKLYILINGQGGGGAWHQRAYNEKYNTTRINGGNAGNSASLMLIMKDTYGTKDDDIANGYSSYVLPQCIIKIPSCPTQSSLVVVENSNRDGIGLSSYNCEIFHNDGQKFIISSGTGGISGDGNELMTNDDNYYAEYDGTFDPSDEQVPDWAKIRTFGRIYDIENTTAKSTLSDNGYHLMPFRATEYKCNYYKYNGKEFTSSTSTWNMIENKYFHGTDISVPFNENNYNVTGGAPSIFARGGCASDFMGYSYNQDYKNIDGTYGSGGGALICSTQLGLDDNVKVFCGAGGAAAFTIGWYETNPS